MIRHYILIILIFTSNILLGQNTNVSLDYLSYTGWAGEDMANNVAVDENGFVYIYGSTTSKTFYDSTKVKINKIGSCSGSVNLFLLKLCPEMDSVIFLTIIGGSDVDIPYGNILIDKNEIYVCGQTNSFDFPAKRKNVNVNKQDFDVFLICLNEKGDNIIKSTIIGGSKDEQYPWINQYQQSILMTLVTSSNDFPLHKPAFKDSLTGQTDLVILKMDKESLDIQMSSYFGGDSLENCRISYVQGDNLYITGSTTSLDFPITKNAHRLKPIKKDMFLSIIDIPNQKIVHSTFLGTNSDDEGKSIFINGENSIFVSGSTYSEHGNFDVFFSRLSKDYQLGYSNSFGSSGIDYLNLIGESKSGELIFTGLTKSNNFPITSNAIDSIFEGTSESVLLFYNQQSQKISYSTYLGGNGGDFVQHSILIDSNSIIMVGGTNSTNFNATEKKLQSDFKGEIDVLISRYKLYYK